MNSKNSTPGAQSETQLVLTAIDAVLFGGCNKLSREIFAGALKSSLRKAGVPCDMFAAYHRPGFLVGIMALGNITERNEALKVIEATLKEWGMLSYFQIGFYCKAEGIWRTIWPSHTPAPPIERFVSLSEIFTSMLENAKEAEFIEKQIKTLENRAARSDQGATGQ